MVYQDYEWVEIRLVKELVQDPNHKTVYRVGYWKFPGGKKSPIVFEKRKAFKKDGVWITPKCVGLTKDDLDYIGNNIDLIYTDMTPEKDSSKK